MPHAYRHVLGWYRLVKELQDAGVSAVCVFDGNERSVAKAREVGRRREALQLAVARGAIELDRVKRLSRLANVLHRFKKLDPSERGRVSELLRQISLTQHTHPSFLQTPSLQGDYKVPSQDQFDQRLDLLLEEEALVLPTYPQDSSHSTTSNHNNDLHVQPHTPPASPSICVSPSYSHAADACNTLYHPRIDPSSENSESKLHSASNSPPASSSPLSSRSSLPEDPLDRPFPRASVPGQIDRSSVSLSDIASSVLIALYSDFRGSVGKLASLTPVVDQQENRAEYTMSKTQIQLTTGEANLWDQLALNGFSSDTPEETLVALTLRARLVSQSYERRTNPPNTKTYDECKELLRSMGVPCIDTMGMYEAEALASSLVINGLADYVASEDTDVVIYEAPLLRNLSNRSEPLIMLSGSEIRTALELDRASFIDFALLLGTDFSQRIKNVGPNRALKFIRQHKSIERVIEAEKKYPPRDKHYLAQVQMGRKAFQTLPPLPDATLLRQETDLEGLSVILQRCGLGKLLLDEEWNFEEALEGNYFSDDPSAL